MFKTRIIALSVLYTISQNSIAADLLETYELAARNDPAWAAKKAEFFSNKEYIALAKSSLLPQIVAGALYAKETYKGISLQNIDATNLNLSQLSQNAPRYTSTCTDKATSNIDYNCVLTAALTDAGVSLLDSATQVRTQDYTRKYYGVQITQPLIHASLWYTYDKAKAAGYAAQASLASEEQNMMMRVVDLYFGTLRAEEEYKYAKAEQNALTALAEGTKQRFQLGLGRASDVYEVQAKYDVSAIELLAAETKLNGMRNALASYTKQTDYSVDQLPDNIPTEQPTPADPKAWEEQALANNYEIVSAQYIVDAADKQVQENLSNHLPTVDFVAQAAHTDVGGGFTPTSDLTSLQLVVQIPIYSGGATDAKTKQARYQKEQARETLRTKRLLTQLNVNTYYAGVSTRAKSVELGRDAIRSTEQAYESTKSGYSGGARPITDVLAAQTNLYRAKKEYANARYDYIIDTLKLKKEAGILTANDLKTLNTWLSSPASITATGQQSLPEPKAPEISKPNSPASSKQQTGQKTETRKGPQSLFDAIKEWKSPGKPQP